MQRQWDSSRIHPRPCLFMYSNPETFFFFFFWTLAANWGVIKDVKEFLCCVDCDAPSGRTRYCFSWMRTALFMSTVTHHGKDEAFIETQIWTNILCANAWIQTFSLIFFLLSGWAWWRHVLIGSNIIWIINCYIWLNFVNWFITVT